MFKHKFILAVSIVTLAFILLPLLMIIITAFGEASIIQFPIKGFTFQWFAHVFQSRSFMSSLKISAVLGLCAAGIGVFVATFTSYALFRLDSKWKKQCLSFFLSPNLIPGIVLGIVLYRTILISFRIDVFVALVIGHILLVLPYSIRVVSSALNEFDISIEEAACSLGATGWQSFFLVVLPCLKNSILAAFMMSFINSFNNLPISMFLKGPGINTLPVTLMNYIEYNFDPSVSALSFLLMIFTFILMQVMDRVLGVKKVV